MFKGIEFLPQTSEFIIPISLKFNGANLWYFKLTLFDIITVIVWNIKGLRDWVATILKLENQSLWQELYSFGPKLRKFANICALNNLRLFYGQEKEVTSVRIKSFS